MTIEEYINKNVEPHAREDIKEDLKQFLRHPDIKDKFETAPGSTTKQYHHAYRGGLIVHCDQLFQIAKAFFGAIESVADCNIGEILTVATLHDFNKVSDPSGRPKYTDNFLKSGSVSEAKPFKINSEYGVWNHTAVDPDNLADPRALEYFLHHAELKPTGRESLMTIQAFAPDLFAKLNDSEKFAIIYHGGAYETSRFELAGKEDMLQIIVHAADMLSSRYDQTSW